MLRPITRRGALAGVAGCVAAGTARSAPASFPDAPTILVAGPAGGRTDRWAAVIAGPLGRALQQGSALARQNVGGPDGVTGANHFQARAAPDGGTTLLVPGAAVLSWLTGDSRVKFDAGRWVPLWGADQPAALASRVPLTAGRRVRMALRSVVGPELAALLALDLMGLEVVPVRADLVGGRPLDGDDVDVALLRGGDLGSEAMGLASRGWELALGFGAIGADGELSRDPSLPDLPIAQELIGRDRTERMADLSAALRAVTAAMKLDLALVLPQLSPAALVAWWRRGCGGLSGASVVQSEASRSLVRPIGPGSTAANVSSISVDAPVLLELRRWLAERYQWRPG